MQEIYKLARKNILNIKPYEPGKPIEEVQREYGLSQVVKLASNENMAGPSQSTIEAMKDFVKNVYLYPDGNCFYLKQDLSAYLGFDLKNIIIGNGTDELIHFIGLTFLNPGEEVITADLTFVRYEAAALLNNCKPIKVPLKDFTYDLPAMAQAITKRTKIIFIANPNNPTGTIVTASQVAKFMDTIPKNIIVAFDEAYYEYVEDKQFPNTLELVRQGYNVIVLRTFSKIFGLAGLRIGYGIASQPIIECLEKVREPFNVNSVAQIAARAALKDQNQIERSRKLNSQGKKYLYQKLQELELGYVPTQSNFIFVNLGMDSRTVFKELLKHGVIIRTGDIFGLPNFARITIGTQEQNEQLINSLKQIIIRRKQN